MSILQRLYDRVRLRMSYATVPKAAVTVRQVRLLHANLVVLANEDVGRQIAVLRRYEPNDSDFIRNQIRANDICFDIGANIGYYTMLMAKTATEGRVYAFEPVPINYHLVCVNALLNNCHHVFASQLALGAQEGTVSFSQSTDGAFSSLIPVGRKQEAASISTQIQTLDAFVAEQRVPRIDVMKVDVEGAEMMVLQGAQRVLRNSDMRPRLILMELYDPNFRAYDTSVEAVVRAMAGIGYSPFVPDNTGGRARFTEQHHNVHQNVFFVAEDCRDS